MTPAAPRPALRGLTLGLSLPEILKAGLILAAFTLATRAWIFGNPLLNNDEQFYLVVGDRLLQGDLMYVDIWDRKPIGLFLIYAFVCWAFTDPLIGYHLFAAAWVALTSAILFVIARRLVSFAAALGSAAAYPAWLLVFGGLGGQSPVFYNLPMVAAAALTFSVVAQADDRRLSLQGCAIMLLTGIAMQIKYTALFEGVFFGLSLLWVGWSRGRPLPRLAADAATWIICALSPTLATYGAYVAAGHGAEFIQTNFVSIFQDKDEFLPALGRLTGLSIGLTPFAVCARIAFRRWRMDRAIGGREARWIFAWAGAACAAFLVYGVWLDFYVLPMLPPLCLVAALAFDSVAKIRPAIAIIIGLGLAGGFGRAVADTPDRGSAQQVYRLAEKVRPHLGSGCLYVNERVPILYLLTHSCLPTRYIFPDHLTWDRYEDSLGVGQAEEMNNLLSRKPSVIVINLIPDDFSNPANMRRLLASGLQRDYRLVDTARVGSGNFAVYALTKRRPPNP